MTALRSSPDVRPATAADLADFYEGHPPAQSMRAWVAVLDGKTIGIAGLIYPHVGAPYIFSEMKPEMKRFPVTIVRAARRFLAALKGVRACAGATDERAERFLSHLGFVHVGEQGGRKVFAFEGAP